VSGLFMKFSLIGLARQAVATTVFASIKDELPKVFERREIMLHSNAAENDLRASMIKRTVSADGRTGSEQELCPMTRLVERIVNLLDKA
jgi:hypothetical protein